MIPGELLRQCDSAEGVAALFRHLGYAASATPIDPAVWEILGVTWHRNPRSAYFHLVTAGALELFLALHEEPSEEIDVQWVSLIQRRNKSLKIVLVSSILSTRNFTLRIDTAGKSSALTIDLDSPHADGLDRLEAIAADAGRLDDAAKTFDTALDRASLGLRFISRFRRAKAALAGHLSAGLSGSSVEHDELALLLLLRILFLYFVQRKGWLAGDSRFLSRRLRRCVAEGTSFHESLIRPLFFGCLNTAAAERSPEARALGEIPYLNGGLFEPSAIEQKWSVSLPNRAWCEVIEQCFELFPFSVREDQVDGLHIDPEMLGRVFESLMLEEERLESGTFYTPKRVVDTLTHRALAEWCGADDPALRRKVSAWLGGETISFTVGERICLKDRLLTVRVIDIACGSGAFLLSALHSIERLDALVSQGAARDRKTITETCLFGVDIKSEAVRLCELRLWLAIVAQASADQPAEPLPNLDRNILQGNSLLSPLDFLGDARRDVYAEWSRDLRLRGDLQDRYRAASGSEKHALTRSLRALDVELATRLLQKSVELDQEALQASPSQTLFDVGIAAATSDDTLMRRVRSNKELIRQLRRGDLSFFSFELHFASVLADGGFGVVLGNPPWVRASRIPATARRQYADRYRFFRGVSGSRGFQQPDLSLCFMEKSLSLLRGGGALAILMPGKIVNAGYAAVLRNELVTSRNLVAVHDWAADTSLFDADVFPVGVVTRNARGSGDVEVAGEGSSFITSAPSLFVSSAHSSPWSFAPSDVRRILSRIRRRNEPLSEVLGRKAVMGVKTGDNARFLFDDLHFSGGMAFAADASPIPLERVARCIRGRDVRRWRSTASSWILLPCGGGSSGDSGRLAYFRPEHLGIKVVWKDVARGLQAVVVPATVDVDGREFPVVPNQTTYCIDSASHEEAFYLSGLLNSTIVGALASDGAERGKDCYFRYFGTTLSATPIPRLENSDGRRQQLIRLARRAHAGQAVDDAIDELVRELFEVSSSELKLLAAFLGNLFGSSRP